MKPDETDGREDLRVKLRAEALRSTYVFGTAVCGFADLKPEFHTAMATWIEREFRPDPDNPGKMLHCRNKLGMTGRGHLKSSLWTVSDKLRRATANPDLRILISNETEDNITKWMNTMQAVILSPVYQWLFPECVPDFDAKRKPRWNQTQLELKRTENWPQATIEGIPVGGASTSNHYEIICIEQGSLVYTSDGLVPIENVPIGTRVLTRTGKYSEVIATNVHEGEKDMVEIRPFGQPEPLRCTHDHLVACWRDGGVQWVEAKDITSDDRLAMPVSHHKRGGNSVSKTDDEVERLLALPDVWRLIGYWLAEGAHTKQDGQVRLTFGKKEMDYAFDCHGIVAKHLGVDCSITRGESSTLLVTFTHRSFKSILAKFGTHSYNKLIPPFAINSDRSYRAEMIRAYFRGDGCHMNGRWSSSTVSRSLAASVQHCLSTLGIKSVVGTGAKGGHKLVVGNWCDTRDAYGVSSSDPLMNLLMGTTPKFPKRDKDRITLVPGFLLSKVRSIKRETRFARVHDLTVRNGESFVVPGVCVHNCNDDVVGKRARHEPSTMQKAIDHGKLCWSLLVNPAENMIHDVGTRWSPDDYLNWRLRTTRNLDIFRLPFWKPGKEGVEALWHERFPLEVIEQIQADLGVELWSLQYLNDPLAHGATDFDAAKLRSFRWAYRTQPSGKERRYVVLERPEHDGGDRWFPVDQMNRVQIMDAGLSPESKDARTANVVVGLVPGETGRPFDIVILRADAVKADPNKAMERGYEVYQDFDPMVWAVESFGAHVTYFYSIASRYPLVRISKLKQDTSRPKESRIREMYPFVDQGRVYVHRSEGHEFVKEFAGFPNGRTVDLLDAFAWAPTIWAPPQTKLTEEDELKRWRDEWRQELQAKHQRTLGGRNPITGY